jgi:hypothetical protein
MIDTSSAPRARRHPDARAAHERVPRRTELWRLLGGAMGDLCAVVIETSVGWALGLELATELLEQFFQPSLVGLALEAAG